MDRIGLAEPTLTNELYAQSPRSGPVGCRSSTLTAIPRSVMHRPAAAGRDIQSVCVTEEAGGLTWIPNLAVAGGGPGGRGSLMGLHEPSMGGYGRATSR